MAENSFPHLARPGELHDHSGGTGSGGDNAPGELDLSKRNKDPAARSTVPPASATNHDHPSAAGTITSHPGGGLDSGVGTAIDSPPAPIDSSQMQDATRGLLNGGINRVEDQAFTGNDRLNPPTDEAGPGPSAGTPELQDPNYTAASDRATK